MTMPTNRSFLSNFFAAFRAHSAIQKAATSPTSPAPSPSPQTSYVHTTTTSASPSTSTSATATGGASTPRAIIAKAGQPTSGATSAAVQAAGQFQPTRQHSTPPYSRSPGSPGSPGSPAFPISPVSGRSRRGSDSSAEGFRDVLGAEKWYIGGRTATGEEKFYKLSVVKRHRSIDRLSLDRLSL